MRNCHNEWITCTFTCSTDGLLARKKNHSGYKFHENSALSFDRTFIPLQCSGIYFRWAHFAIISKLIKITLQNMGPQLLNCFVIGSFKRIHYHSCYHLLKTCCIDYSLIAQGLTTSKSIVCAQFIYFYTKAWQMWLFLSSAMFYNTTSYWVFYFVK